MKPNNQEALQFLQKHSISGPWVLTAITPDRQSIDTASFDPGTSDKMMKWLELYNGSRNIYFNINPVIKPTTKKAQRSNVKEMSWIHIDVDPRAGESLKDEQKRIKALLTKKLPSGIPEPTWIIFSGGGYQAAWRLEEPIPINGEEEKYENAKLYNQQMEVIFRSDACHNLDRIFRLPGTINLPDATKRKKGRKAALAELLSFNADNKYPISQFTKANAVEVPHDGGQVRKIDKTISHNVEFLADVHSLDEWDVPARVKVAVVQGHHPDEPKEGDNSRSAWLFDVCCNLLRLNVPENIVYSVITDPKFAISESVLELGSASEKYALRQISRAKEEVEEPWLRKLNDQHAVIESFGGKCVVIEEQFDPVLSRSRLIHQTFTNFQQRYLNQKIKIGEKNNGQPVYKTVGKYWLEHPHRRQFSSVVFSPGRDHDGIYNLWRGFSVKSIPGKCELFLEHTLKNICKSDEELYKYLIRWMAKTVQSPGQPGQVAIVLRGGRGTGKSIWAKTFGHLFGRHYMQVSNPAHLIGTFNGHLRDVVLLFGDEAFYAGDKKHSSVLKTLITEDFLAIEQKGIDVETSMNCIHLIMASNDEHVVPAGMDERRFLVLDIGEDNKQDTKFFAAMQKQMDDGGYEALLHHLMNFDLNGYQIRDVPKTKALVDQKLLSLSNEQEWWYNKLCTGSLYKDEGWLDEIPKNLLLDEYTRYLQKFNTLGRSNATKFGMFLKQIIPNLREIRRRASSIVVPGSENGRTTYLIIPNLEVCRKHWEGIFGAQDWSLLAVEQEHVSKNDPDF